MSEQRTVLVLGTFDTKADELQFIINCLASHGVNTLAMDVGVLKPAAIPVDISNAQVAAAADVSLASLVESGDENTAMQAMAQGGANLIAQAYEQREIDGMIALGGTMGTDLALECAAALPVGVPKLIVSTVAFSPLIPSSRIPPDVQMILWAGGLYGLNPICKSTLSQAAGAIAGATKAADIPDAGKPLVGMTSLGKSCLSYMVALQPALRERGFELAVFHSTGMGGRAFERLARQGAFCCVMDLCVQELANALNGSLVSSGPDRLTNAGDAAIPQIVAPGASDLLDVVAWQPLPAALEGRPYHAHNRLIASVTLSPRERQALAHEIGSRLARAKGPTAFVLPTQGIEAWDKPGEPAHDPDGLRAFVDAARQAIQSPTEFIELDAHINDQAFADAVIGKFDEWLAAGKIRR